MRWWKRANIGDLKPKLMFYIIHRHRGLGCPPSSFLSVFHILSKQIGNAIEFSSYVH